MIKRVDHIAIAVRSIQDSRQKFEKLYGAKFILEQVNEKGKYKVAILKIGENLFSLLESTDPEGFVAKHIEKYGEGIQHMGIEVKDLDEVVSNLAAEGAKVVDGDNVEGVRREVLVSPKYGLGTVLQLMEWLGEYKDASPEERMLKAWKA